jgi:hypothetical protein
MAKGAVSTKMKSFRILTRVTVESWHDIKAESYEEAGMQADALKVEDLVTVLGEFYDQKTVEVTSICTN